MSPALTSAGDERPALTMPTLTTMTSETETDETDEEVSPDADAIREFAESLDFEAVEDQDHAENLGVARGCSRNAVETVDDGSAELIGRQYGTLSASHFRDAISAGYVPREFVEDDGDAAIVFKPMSSHTASKLLRAVADGIETAAEAEPQGLTMPAKGLIAARGGSWGGTTDYGEDNDVALYLLDDALEVSPKESGGYRVKGNYPEGIGNVGSRGAGSGAWSAEEVFIVASDEELNGLHNV